MRTAPLRFVHAAQLQLDHQLQGVGEVPADLRLTIRDATHTTFEHIIEVCIEQQVDFLLLAGDSFNAADQSLTAQTRLAEGLEYLAEEGIPVFLTPGITDPEHAWRPGIPLPANVTVFDEQMTEPVDVVREGQLLARIFPFTAEVEPGAERAPRIRLQSGMRKRFAVAEESALRIGMVQSMPHERHHGHGISESELRDCPIRYWAFGAGLDRATWGMGRGTAHAPGKPQGLSPGDIGPRGCTLVEVDEAGQITPQFIPVSTVRWEQLAVTVQPADRRVDLLAALELASQELEPNEFEKLWLLEWVIGGSGPLLDKLTEPEYQQAVWTEWQKRMGEAGLVAWTRSARLRDVASAEEELDETIPMRADFREHLEGWMHDHPDPLRDALDDSELRGGPAETELRARLLHLDSEQVLQFARHWGRTAFNDLVDTEKMDTQRADTQRADTQRADTEQIDIEKESA